MSGGDDLLWAEFAAESEEHLDALERRLGAGAVLDRPGIDELFRAFHSLKGMADALGAAGMKTLAHRCEDVLGAARAQRLSVAGPVAAVLLEAVDGLRRLRALMVSARRDAAPDGMLLGRLGALVEGDAAAAAPARAAGQGAPSAERALLASLASRFQEAAPRLALRLSSRRAEAEVAAAEARDLAAAAKMLGLGGLSATLAALAGTAAGAGALPLLGRLRRQLGLLAARSGEAAGERRLAAAATAAAPHALGPALAVLAPRLEDVAAGEGDGTNAREAASEAALVACALGLDEVEMELLRLEDVLDRAGEPEAAALLAREGPALADRVRAGIEGHPVPLFVASAALQGSALPSHVPAEFASALGPASRVRLDQALAEGVLLHRCRVAIGAPAELEQRLGAWLRDNAPPIASRSVLDAARPHLDLLLASRTPSAELSRRMEAIDPAHHLVFSLEPLEPTGTAEAAPATPAAAITLRVRQDALDAVIALEEEARTAALGVTDALHDEAANAALLALGRLESRLSGPAAREVAHARDALLRRVDKLSRAEHRLAGALRRLDEAMLELRTVPIGNLLARLPRVARAVAEAGEKDVEVRLEGQDVQVDRAVVELLADPLLHLVRNAVDHGAEPPAERRRLGKPSAMRLHVSVERRLSQVRVTVQDDGRGVDHAAVLARAVERGLLTAEAAARASEADASELLFLPGFTTAAAVTATSGRGVGLDVVRAALRRAGGAVEIRSRAGEGTVFTIVLPVLAAVQRVLLVEAGGQPCGVPESRVEAVLAAAEGDEGARPAGGVGSLAELLGLAAEPGAPGGVIRIATAAGPRLLGVDRVRGAVSLLLRPLHPSLARLPAVAGVGVLGGEPVLVLEPDALGGSPAAVQPTA